MFKEIANFVIDNLISIIFGLIWLVVILVFLPTNVVVKVVKTIKPKIFEHEKRKYKQITSVISSIFLNNSFADLNIDNKKQKKFKKIELLHNNNRKIERNIYFLDLCIDMLAMLHFALPNALGCIDYQVMGQAMNYLGNYSKLLEPFEQNKNFTSNISREILALEETFNEWANGQYKDNIKNVMDTFFRQKYESALEYLQNEKKNLEALLISNKKEIITTIGEAFENA